MKCIDAIEGTVKCILNRIHEVSLEDRMDDSEYVRSVKAVIDATDDFVEGNQEVVPDRDLLKTVLYSYSKDLWRSTPGGSPEEDTAGLSDMPSLSQEAHSVSNGTPAENDGYRDYYFDYLYRHGVYPR